MTLPEGDDAPGGVLHSWDLSTGVDGPGTRFVAFLAGCPLRCRYCHNPDTWRRRGGHPVTVDEITREIIRFRRFISVAGGGFTVSGGEPLAQPEFTAALLRRARELGMHAALDTSGFFRPVPGSGAVPMSGDGGVPGSGSLKGAVGEGVKGAVGGGVGAVVSPAVEAVIAETDLVLLDIKSWHPDTYRDLTGVSVRPTLAFARRLAERGTPTWVRFVLVPGVTDVSGNIDGVAEFTAGLGNVERVDVLPFHRLGAAKYARIGIPFPLAGVAPPDADALSRARDRFRAAGLVVT